MFAWVKVYIVVVDGYIDDDDDDSDDERERL